MESMLLSASSLSVLIPWLPKSSNPAITNYYRSRRSCIFPAKLSTHSRRPCIPRLSTHSSMRSCIIPIHASATPQGFLAFSCRSAEKDRVDESHCHILDDITGSLYQQDDKIMNSLMERAQYCYNAATYKASLVDGFQVSVLEIIIREFEKVHAQMGRYNGIDKYPFFPDDLPEPMRPPIQYPVLHPIARSININNKIWDMYFKNLLPRLVKQGDDGYYGSVAACDLYCLQALSKRVHYGKFVAEAKFRASPEDYEPAIKVQDSAKLMTLLSYPIVEKKTWSFSPKVWIREITKQIAEKDHRTRQEEVKIDGDEGNLVYTDVYKEWIMALTNEVQVEYLLRRLD